MKNLMVLFFMFFLTSVNALAKPILSGYDYNKKPVYFEDTSIISYGKIVTGTIQSSKNGQDESSLYSKESNYIYFCPFDSLETTLDKTNYYEPDGNYKNSVTSDLSEQTYPISRVSNTEIDEFNGLAGFRKKLKSKCSLVIKKFPRFEIPIAQTDKDIYHMTLDTIKTQGVIKSAWLKRRVVNGEVTKKSDGTPLIIGGNEWKVFSFVKDANYDMSEFQVDCKNQKIQISQVVEYASNGSIVSSNTFPLDVKNMTGIVPNSIGEGISKFMCSF